MYNPLCDSRGMVCTSPSSSRRSSNDIRLPLQSGCQSNINSHPLDHLQAAHGFDVTYSSFSCPAPACAPENQVFCNPAMLHNHFDQAHATPATGSLFCQWNDCNSTFTDQRELLYHLTEDHR